MPAERITRLIFISSMGIDDEMPGQRYSSALDPYRDCAAIIEQSDLDFTILRPGWFTGDEAIPTSSRRRATRSRDTTSP